MISLCNDIIILLLIMRGHIYIYIYICPSVLLVIHDIFRSVPVWQKSNMSLTPVSQVNYRNFCPKQSNFNIPLPVDLRLRMDRQQMKTLEISSRRASFFLNFDKKSRINRDRRPRVPASLGNN